MPNIITKFAALALLLTIPLQGITATLLVLQCAPIEADVAYSPNSDDGAIQERDGEIAQNLSEHFFCYQVFSGIPIFPAAGTAPDLPVFQSSASLLSNLFLPEQPQRPPFSR